MIQTKLFTTKRFVLKYTNTTNDDKNEKLDLDNLESQGASQKAIKTIEKFVEKSKFIHKGRPETYWQSFDSRLNEWLEKFHLKKVSRKDGGYVDMKIIDIKFAFANEDGAAYPHALVIYEDGN